VSTTKGEFRTAIRYSEAFKLEVVRELERELAPLDHVRRKYGIGVGTIQDWIAKYGNGTRGKVIRVETPQEVDELKKLRERIKRLESLLADTNLELALERQYTRLACERAGIEDVAEFKKKRLGSRPSSDRTRRGFAGSQREEAVPEAGHEPAELLRPSPRAPA
jgi:transposase-like protein